MKKLFFLSSILLCSFITASACEICGCGIGNYFIGFLPQFNRHFVGLRYQYKKFHTNIKEDPSEFSRDQYTTFELWGGWNIGKRWQVVALLPYNFVRQVSDEGVKNINGIGDIALFGNYKLADKTSSTGKKQLMNQQLWIGVGIKVPTGKFAIEETDDDLVSKSNIQPGSGSTDFMANISYNVRISKWGINSTALYKINTGNRDHYRFGDKASASSFVSYAVKKKRTTLIPNAGIMYEHTAANIFRHEKIEQTRGHLVAAAAGLEIEIKKITFGTNIQLPVSQNFAGHQTTTRFRTMAHISFSL